MHGDKGGIGKSQAAHRTAAALLSAEIPIDLVDGDAKNPGLHAAFSGRQTVHRIDVMRPKGRDELFELIASSQHDVLVDLPAGASTATARMTSNGTQEGEIDLSALLHAVDAQLIVMFVLDQNIEPIAALRDELSILPADAKWVLVRNHFQDRPFTDLEASKTFSRVTEAGGAVIDMVRLDPSVTVHMMRSHTNLIDIQSDPNASLIQRIRAQGALQDWMKQLSIAGVIAS